MKIVLVLVLTIHGLIVVAQSPTAFRAGAGVPNPPWLAWWPTALGETWLAANPLFSRPPFAWLLGLGWLAGGLLLIAAGLALAGVLITPEYWRFLATLGAALSLAMLLLYLHPFYLVGLAVSLAILAELRWVHWIPSHLLGA